MYRRPSAVLILYNDKGEILLQHRAPDALRNPNYWGLFGGGIEADETPLQALEREIFEELEYRVGKPDLLESHEFTITQTDGAIATGTRHVFIDRYDPTQVIVQREGQGLGWFLPDDTVSLLMSDRGRATVVLAKEYIRNKI